MTSDIRIEKAQPAHLAEILALVIAGAAGARVGQETGRVEDYREAFDAMLAAPEMDVYVALDGHEVVGTYQIHYLKGLAYQGRSRVELESVHTRADRRGQGIGALMMAHAEMLAREAGVGVMQLTSNKVRIDAHRFYVRLGFDQSHFGFKKTL